MHLALDALRSARTRRADMSGPSRPRAARHVASPASSTPPTHAPLGPEPPLSKQELEDDEDFVREERMRIKQEQEESSTKGKRTGKKKKQAGASYSIALIPSGKGWIKKEESDDGSESEGKRDVKPSWLRSLASSVKRELGAGPSGGDDGVISPEQQQEIIRKIHLAGHWRTKEMKKAPHVLSKRRMELEHKYNPLIKLLSTCSSSRRRCSD